MRRADADHFDIWRKGEQGLNLGLDANESDHEDDGNRNQDSKPSETVEDEAFHNGLELEVDEGFRSWHTVDHPQDQSPVDESSKPFPTREEGHFAVAAEPFDGKQGQQRPGQFGEI